MVALIERADAATPDPATLTFTGYAALFDIRDRGGDVIRPGAFAGLALPVPLLWQHDPARRIGTIEHAQADKRGLRISGHIAPTTAMGREAARLVASGVIDGLSFGYRVRASHAGPMGRGGSATRILTGIDLVEISLVSAPMQPGARLTPSFTHLSLKEHDDGSPNPTARRNGV